MHYVVAGPDVASVYNLKSLIPVWLTLQIAGGQIGLALVVLTFLLAPRSTGRPRYVTLINFCATWILYSIIYCILLYSGQTSKNLEMPSRLCLVQAALIHGAPPMCAIAGFEMVLQLWFVQRCIHRTTFPYLGTLPAHLLNFLIILPPYIAFIGFSLLAMGHGITEKNLILSLNHIYCSSQSYRFSLIVPIFCAVVMAAILFVEGKLKSKLYATKPTTNASGIIWFNWYKTRKEVDKLLKGNQVDSLTIITAEFQNRRLSFSISLRVGLFSLYSIATLSACLVFVSNRPSPFPYMVEACLPIAAFLLFGTQRDILEFWFCHRRPQRSRSMRSVEEGMPSTRASPASPSIESIFAPSVTILTPSTLIASSLSRELTRVEEEDQLRSTKTESMDNVARTCVNS